MQRRSDSARCESGPTGRLRQRPGAAARRRMSIPIVDAHGRIVGWTDVTPEFRGASLHQPEAERLLGAAYLAAYVRIEDAEDAERAGAPPGWQGGWRCLALCSARLVSGRAGDPIVPVAVRSPRHGNA